MKRDRTSFFTFLFSFCILAAGVITQLVLDGKNVSHEVASYRYPANIEQCTDLVNETVLLFRPPPGLHLWKRLAQSNFSLNDFSMERFKRLEELYVRELNQGSTDLRPEGSPEGLLAFIRATKAKAGDPPQEISKVSRRQARALNNHLKKMAQYRKLSLADIDDLTTELFTANFGPQKEFSDLFSFSRRQRELITEVASLDIARRGFFENFSYFRFLEANPSLYRRFGRSRFAYGLKVGILNLPMLLGLPPLYLPKFKAPKLSIQLSEELLAEGMTDEVYRKIQREIGSRLLVQDKYDEIRKYYMYGVMIYLVMAQAYETYQLEGELEESREMIEEAQSKALEITGSIQVLEEAGIDVFSDEEIEEGNIFCQNLKDCFEAFSVELNDTESDGYKTCQDVIDPGNQCTSL
jgi:hypothetical protein